MIDVMVLTLPERETWLQTCLDSMKDQPVQIHVVAGVEPNQFSVARQASYQLGSHEYLCHVDDDDWAVSGIFESIESAFNRYPDAGYVHLPFYTVYPNGQTRLSKEGTYPAGWLEPGNLVIAPHFTIYRRSMIAPIMKTIDPSQTKDYDLSLQVAVKKQCGGVLLKTPGYYWRIHPQQLHQKG